MYYSAMSSVKFFSILTQIRVPRVGIILRLVSHIIKLMPTHFNVFSDIIHGDCLFAVMLR